MGGLAQRDVVAVLTRAPSAGGKSRLFAELGTPPDPALLAALLLDTLDTIEREDVTRVVAVEPLSACDDVRALVGPHIRVIAQPAGTLGDRMAGVMREMLDDGARAVAVIGSDLPALSPAELARAFALLHDDPHSVVLGPADDGGYYLIAACRVPDLFHDIEWGSAHVFEQTRTAATGAGIRLHVVGAMRDVDTVADLLDLMTTATIRESTGGASRTLAWARARGIIEGKRQMIKGGNRLPPRSGPGAA